MAHVARTRVLQILKDATCVKTGASVGYEVRAIGCVWGRGPSASMAWRNTLVVIERARTALAKV